ncbi:Protein OBERON 2 [Ananas comosus]|uniref:Protein OBERON 2 n=1 Tax=Ananas comosus TaxID=4615 RepID=A0A199VF10_ANACO|nr:Protein OBERON 2 [Ananas comosus]
MVCPMLLKIGLVMEMYGGGRWETDRQLQATGLIGTEKNVHTFKGVSDHTESESPVKAGDCKARNKLCNRQKEAKTNASAQKECDICCVEAGFCRDCCCILCSKTIDPAHDGYSFVKCEAIIDRNQICGHIAHIECALRSYMAGTVGGSIGLDVEYYCRRCDNKTDLMPHVTKIVQICESLDSEDEIGQILNLGLCILRGSQQMRAKILRNGIMSILGKLKCGANLNGIWRGEDNAASVHTAGPYPKSEVTVLEAQQTGKNERAADCASIVHPLQKSETNHRPVYITSDDGNISAKLEDEIDSALKELKKSQESECKIAEQKLYAQKDFLLSLYRLLESERSELADPMPSPNSRNCDTLLSNVLNRVDQIKREEEKFRSMLKISNGFGRTPQNIVRQHFGLTVDD